MSGNFWSWRSVEYGWSEAPGQNHGGDVSGISQGGATEKIQDAVGDSGVEGVCEPGARHDEVCGDGGQ